MIAVLTNEKIKSFEEAEEALKIDQIPEVSELKGLLPEIEVYLRNKGYDISGEKIATKEDMARGVELLRKVSQEYENAVKKIEEVL